MNQIDNTMGLYVHIPFCVKKCDYCDFLSAPAGAGTQLRYMEALREELRLTAGERAGLPRHAKSSSVSFPEVHESAAVGDGGKIDGFRCPVNTIFFGGGTPSILPAEEIAKTLQTVRACFPVEEDAEITVECNPGTLTEEKCRAYRSCGVNRLSIGLQSADDRLLKGIGRIHTFEEFLESYRAARRAGFTNINIDLMSGLPGQSVKDHVDTLRRVVKLRPEHISAYSLILEEGTRLYERVMGENRIEQDGFLGKCFELMQRTEKEEKRWDGFRMTEEMGRDDSCICLPSEDEEMEMYVKTREILEACGYRRYEISNYSLPGRECRHNLRYWNLSDYLGFGIGAASFADGCRYKNTEDRERYVEVLLGRKNNAALQAENPRTSNHSENNVRCGEKILPDTEAVKNDSFEERDECEKVAALREEFSRESDRELMEEFLFLGLRKTEGISTDEFAGRFGMEFDSVYGAVRKKLAAQGFLEETPGGHRLHLTDRGLDFSNEVLAEFLR